MATLSARLAAIDALRVAAVCGVVAAHWTWSPAWVHEHFDAGPEETFGGLTMVIRYGFLGVQLFFVISGAVIARTVQGRTVGQFVAARVARIAPAYWVAVCLAACLHAIDGDRPPLSLIADTTANLFLVVLVPCWWLCSTATIAAANPAGRSPLALAAGIALILSALPALTWTRLAAWRSDTLAAIGLMTYPVYLFHVTPGRRLIGSLLDANVASPVAYALGAAITLGLATATVRLDVVRSRLPRLGSS